MHIGFQTGLASREMNLRELAAWARAHEFDCLEVSVGPRGHLDPVQVLEKGPEEVKGIMEENGVFISALAPMLNLLDADPKAREERIAYLKLTIQAAARLGVPVVVTYAGSAFGMHFYGFPGVPWGHPSNKVEENLRLFTEIYTPLAAYAEEYGIKIAFETAPRGGGHGNLAHSPQLWEMMFEAVPSPALGLSLDPSHLVWLHIENIPGVIREFGPRLYHIDGKDTEILPEVLARQGLWGNAWWRYRVPGMGTLDWAAIISALIDACFEGAIDIENEDPLFPGLVGCEIAGRHLRNILPKEEQGA